MPIKRSYNRHACDPRRRPQEHLGGAVFADDLGLDEGRTNLEPPRQMEAKAQGIEESAAAQHTLVAGEASDEVRQGVGRIGDD
jgi:hypothetical protein